MQEDFISLYLKYTKQTECPTFFNRWCAITCLSAYMGKRVHFKFGHFNLYPNLYTMLIGSPGTKKSSAIKISAGLLKKAGYKSFAAKKTRQEKYLLDLAERSDILYKKNSIETEDIDDILDKNLWGDDEADEADNYNDRPPAESFIAADEFNNFVGMGNMDFISILGDLWDIDEVFDYKLKNSKSVFIPYPCISILGGNTPTGFSQAFSVESIGQGFFSRLLLIYGEPSGIKYTFPPPPDLDIQEKLIGVLRNIKRDMIGEMNMSEESKKMLDSIYHSWEDLDDLRFEHYSNRRLTHLIKLSLVLTCSRGSLIIELEDIVHANTILTFTESLMPKALGEFGKSKNSAVSHKVMESINKTRVPIPFVDIWKLVHVDLEDRKQLMDILNNLQVAEKIQVVKGEPGGFLPVKKVKENGPDGSTDFNKYLTIEERRLL